MSCSLPVLTHFPLDKMTAISQTIFSDTFSWIESLAFWLKFHWSLFLMVQLTIPSTDLDNGVAPQRRQAIIWTNTDLIHWRIYAALGGWVKLPKTLHIWARYMVKANIPTETQLSVVDGWQHYQGSSQLLIQRLWQHLFRNALSITSFINWSSVNEDTNCWWNVVQKVLIKERYFKVYNWASRVTKMGAGVGRISWAAPSRFSRWFPTMQCLLHTRSCYGTRVIYHVMTYFYLNGV